MSRVSGPFMLNKHVSETHISQGRGSNAENTLIDDADERLAACIYLNNNDQTTHGSITENLNIKRSLKMTKFLKQL